METMEFLGLEIGSWADWVSGVGTILAIIVSLFILYYQTKKSIEITSHQFFLERNNSNFDKAEILLVNDWYILADISTQVKDIISTKAYPFNESSINIKNAKRVSYFIKQLTEMKSHLAVIIVMLSRLEEKSNTDNLFKAMEGTSMVTTINSDLVELIKNFREINGCQDNYKKVLTTINQLCEKYSDERKVIIELRRGTNS